MSSFIVLQSNIGSGNHTLVRWPKDVTLGDLVRERFECKEETELMFCVPTPKGFLNWHESNIINEVEVRGYADGCDNPFVVTVTDKAASSREVRDHEVYGKRINIHMDTFNQHTSVPGFHQRPPKRSIKNFEALKDHFVRVLGDHKNVVNPVLVICPVCKRAIRLSNSPSCAERSWALNKKSRLSAKFQFGERFLSVDFTFISIFSMFRYDRYSKISSLLFSNMQ